MGQSLLASAGPRRDDPDPVPPRDGPRPAASGTPKSAGGQRCATSSLRSRRPPTASRPWPSDGPARRSIRHQPPESRRLYFRAWRFDLVDLLRQVERLRTTPGPMTSVMVRILSRATHGSAGTWPCRRPRTSSSTTYTRCRRSQGLLRRGRLGQERLQGKQQQHGGAQHVSRPGVMRANWPTAWRSPPAPAGWALPWQRSSSTLSLRGSAAGRPSRPDETAATGALPMSGIRPTRSTSCSPGRASTWPWIRPISTPTHAAERGKDEAQLHLHRPQRLPAAADPALEGGGLPRRRRRSRLPHPARPLAHRHPVGRQQRSGGRGAARPTPSARPRAPSTIPARPPARHLESAHLPRRPRLGAGRGVQAAHLRGRDLRSRQPSAPQPPGDPRRARRATTSACRWRPATCGWRDPAYPYWPLVVVAAAAGQPQTVASGRDDPRRRRRLRGRFHARGRRARGRQDGHVLPLPPLRRRHRRGRRDPLGLTLLPPRLRLGGSPHRDCRPASCSRAQPLSLRCAAPTSNGSPRAGDGSWRLVRWSSPSRPCCPPTSPSRRPGDDEPLPHRRATSLRPRWQTTTSPTQRPRLLARRQGDRPRRRSSHDDDGTPP